MAVAAAILPYNWPTRLYHKDTLTLPTITRYPKVKKNSKVLDAPLRRDELLNQPKGQVLILTENELSQVAGGRGKTYQLIMSE
jgi:hypothetical protein